MAQETLTPSSATEGTGTFVNTANMYDDDAVTYGIMGTTEENAADISFSSFTADSDPDNRDLVKIRLKLRYPGNANQRNKIGIYFRQTAGSPWSLVDEDTHAGGNGNKWPIFPSPAAWREIDVTALAGSNPSTGFQVGVQFYRGTVANPDLPTMSLP